MEIAEKAIVCYRCGTPTADPAVAAASRPRRGIPPAMIALGVVVGLIAVGLAVYLTLH